MTTPLELHLDLPGTVRTALRGAEVLDTSEDRHDLPRATAHTVVSIRHEGDRRQVAEDMRLDREDGFDVDEAIPGEAVRATATPR